MPLDRLEVRSFKSIVNQTMDFGRVNVFIGANGSGKTNLLEAIGVLSCALSGEVSYAALAKRGIRLSTPGLFASSFRNIERPQAFSLKADMGSLRYEASLLSKNEGPFHYAAEKLVWSEGAANRDETSQRLRLDEAKQPDSALSVSAGMLPTVCRLHKFNHQPIEALRSYAIYAPNTFVLRGLVRDPSIRPGDPKIEAVQEPAAQYTLGESRLGLHGHHLANAVKEIVEGPDRQARLELQRCLQSLSWFDALEVIDRAPSLPPSSPFGSRNLAVRFKDKFLKESHSELQADDVSEGALFTLFALVLLLHQHSPNVYALENLDSCLHPNLVSDLMSHINQLAVKAPAKQLFITTHNPSALDAVDLFDDGQRLFEVFRNKEGHTEVSRIEPPKGFTRDDWVKKHGGMRLSEIWHAGIIGSKGWEYHL